MSCPEELTGYVTMPDGGDVTYDALPVTNFRLLLPKCNNMVFFLQEFDLPDIFVNEVKVPTPLVDINEIGEKIVFTEFTCNFLVDTNVNNFREIYDWMKRMTVRGTNVGEDDNAILIINGKERIHFFGLWPTRLGGLNFVATNPSVQYIKGRVTFKYDYFEFL